MVQSTSSFLDEESGGPKKSAVYSTNGNMCLVHRIGEEEDWEKKFGSKPSQNPEYERWLQKSHVGPPVAEDWGDFFADPTEGITAAAKDPKKYEVAKSSGKEKQVSGNESDEEDEDDWDSEFGIENSGEQKPLSLAPDCSVKSSREDKSGSQQTESLGMRESTRQLRKGSAGGENDSAVPTITGIKANPMQTETDWDDAFAFDSSPFSVSTLSLTKSSSLAHGALDSDILRVSDVPKDPSLRQSGVSESRDITEARFLLQCIPDISVVGSGSREVVPVWQKCDAQHVFPSWFTQKQPTGECKTVMQKGSKLWTKAISLSSQNLLGAIDLSRQVLALFDDYTNLSPVEISFLCLVSLHIALFDRQMADFFKETESLRKGIEIATSESVLTVEPYASDETLASVRAALYYESARAAISIGSDSALPFAIKFLRAVIMVPGKNEPSTTLVWSSVARACCLIARSLPKGSHVQ